MPETNLTKSIDLDERMSATNYIPNLTLIHGTSAQAKEGITPGHFVVGKQDVSDKFTIVVVTSRVHAILFENGEKSEESFNHTSAIYKKIEGLPRKYPSCNPLFGYSFLIWLPDTEQFAIYHPNTKSARRVGVEIAVHSRLPEERKIAQKSLLYTQMFSLSSAVIPIKGNTPSYFAPVVQALEPDSMMLPTKEQTEEPLLLFQAPIKAEGSTSAATDDDPER